MGIVVCQQVMAVVDICFSSEAIVGADAQAVNAAASYVIASSVDRRSHLQMHVSALNRKCVRSLHPDIAAAAS